MNSQCFGYTDHPQRISLACSRRRRQQISRMGRPGQRRTRRFPLAIASTTTSAGSARTRVCSSERSVHCAGGRLMSGRVSKSSQMTLESRSETVLFVIKTAVFWAAAPCRVVYVVDEPNQFSFAYGTLPGHPEQGEAAMIVERNEIGEVVFRIVSFSRTVDPLARL